MKEEKGNPFEGLDDVEENAPDRLKNQILGSYNFLGGVLKGVEFFVENFTNALLGLVQLLGSLGNEEDGDEEPPQNDKKN